MAQECLVSPMRAFKKVTCRFSDSYSRLGCKILFTLLALLPLVGIQPALAENSNASKINLPNALASGECEETRMDGQVIRICKDSKGQYRILPKDDSSSINLSQAHSANLTYQRVYEGLLRKDFCPADCASKLANEYVTKHHPNFMKTVERALTGDPEANRKLFVIYNTADWSHQKSAPLPTKERVIKARAPDMFSNSILSFLSPTPCYGDGKPGSACYDTQEDYDAVKQAEENSKRTMEERAKRNAAGPTEKQKNLTRNYTHCLYRSFGKNIWDRLAFQNCIDDGIAMCNGEEIPTARDYTISPVTGRVALSNNQCGTRLEGWYEVVLSSFWNEYDHYERSEAAGVAYKPATFDLRQYVGNAF